MNLLCLGPVRTMASLCSAAMVRSGHILLYLCDAGALDGP